jgi:hypothetical protein
MAHFTAYELGIGRGGGVSFHGAGFPLRHAGRNWLITCQHNLEDDPLKLTGDIQYPEVRIVQPAGGQLNLNDGRMVVRVRVAGAIADCVAIEVRAGELPTSAFDHDETFPFDLVAAKASSTLVEGTLDGRSVQFSRTVSAWFVIAGYPRPGAAVQLLLVSDVGVPAPESFMLSYHPGAVAGYSGGPLIKADGERASIIGIHTNSYLVDWGIEISAGQSASVSSRAGAAVPIGILLRAVANCSSSEGGVVDIGQA